MVWISTVRAWLGAALLALPAVALAAGESERLEGGVNPGYHEPPGWFKASFLELPDDIAEAAAAERRLLLYFYQDGCPYCAKLLQDNFGQRAIAEKTQSYYDVVALNMWGDRELVAPNGELMTEKGFAEKMRVMFTPTLVFLDEQGKQVLRLNGYYRPAKFDAALEWASGNLDTELSFREYLAQAAPAEASGVLHDEPFFQDPPYNLARNQVPASRPLLVLFEQKRCRACDELHGDILQREATRELIERFDVVQLDMWADTPVITPRGERVDAREWARELGIKYAPSMVFFDERGNEVFRTEAYLRAFHTQAALDYVASGAYREQPNFQRFVQARADHLEEQGIEVDLWQ